MVIKIIPPIGFPCIFYSILFYLGFVLTSVILVDSKKSFRFNFRLNTFVYNVEKQPNILLKKQRYKNSKCLNCNLFEAYLANFPADVIINLFSPGIPLRSDNTELNLKSNISKTVRKNVTFTRVFFKEYPIGFLMISWLIDFATVILQLFMFKVQRNFGISKIQLLNFSGTEKVKILIKLLDYFQKVFFIYTTNMLFQTICFILLHRLLSSYISLIICLNYCKL